MSGKRLLIPVMRATIQALIQFGLTACFFFTAKSGVNPGIISSIFAGGLIFVAIYFHFMKGQRLTLHDLIGTVFVTLCVVLISLGSAFKSSDSTDEQEVKVENKTENLQEEDDG